MNYYPHHIGDFRSGTVNMSRLSRWIYRDMMDVYYDTEKPLPADLDLLCDMIGVETDEERRIVERLLRFKFTKAEDGYRHERCEAEIAAYRTKAETAKTNGKKGASTRYQGGEYMPSEGDMYAVRVSDGLVKVGITANLKSRLHQLRSKYGSHAKLVHKVAVSKMGDAEAELLSVYEDVRDGEEIPIAAGSESMLISHMDRISVAYRVASKTPGGSQTNQEPITNKYSVPNGTGGKPPQPPSAADLIFANGVPLLVAAGLTDKHARQMLGMFRKQHSDEAVVAALQQCADEQAIEPVGYLQRVLRTQPRQSANARAPTRADQNASWMSSLWNDPQPVVKDLGTFDASTGQPV